MKVSKNELMKLLNKLYIITPLKGNNIKNLGNTIKSIKKSFIDIKVIHLVVFFQTKESKISLIEIQNKNNNFYNLVTIKIKKPGIYTAINFALDTIKADDFYMVVGSGDVIESVYNKKISITQEEIILLNYELSTLEKITLIRDKYLGMPYCHNAIIFKNNSLRYSTDYSISSDYDYFLNYLNRCKINLENLNKYINYDLRLIFEAKVGLSSNSRIRKNFENFMICYKFFGFKGIINFIINNLKKTKLFS